MTDNGETRVGRLTRSKRILMGSVFAVALGGIVAGQAVILPDSPARAQDISAQITQPLSFADVVERVQPAVVSIRVTGQAPESASVQGGQGIPDGHPLEEFFRRFGQEGQPGIPGLPGMPGRGGEGRQPQVMGQGSGFFISGDGFVVTNNHVVENADEVTVVMDDGAEYEAEVIGTDPKTDLALVKVNAERQFPHVSFETGESRVGDWVVAVGNPFGLGGSVTAGIISARGRDIGAGPYDDFLQIDASINKGNSGGPAFNLEGDVVGVNTAIFSPSGGSVGIGFAIPAATVQTVIEDLKDDGRVVRGWLGVQIQPVTEDLAESLGLQKAAGALVNEPQPDSPAAKAGLKPGDAILAVDGKPVEDARDLARRIASFAPNTKVDLTVWRDGEEETVAVDLGTLPDEQQLARAGGGSAPAAPAALEEYGLSLAPAAQAGAGDTGVVVTGLDPEGPAAEKGMREGDVILEVAGKPVQTPGDVEKGFETAAESGRKSVLLRVRSGDASRFLALELAKA